MNSYYHGIYAEFLARMYMRLHGYHIICRNFVTGSGTTAGEIDFVAKKGHQLIFAEVKQRSSFSTAAYAITQAQQRRIIRGAESFIQHNPQYRKFDLRFDAILITMPFNIRHIKNAWIV